MSISRIHMAAGGPDFSRLCWGAWRLADAKLNAKDVVNLIRTAIDLGITTIDHADIYGDYTCEKLFGDALAGERQLRSQLQLITKCGIKLVSPNRPAHAIKQYDTSYQHIIASAESSMKNLRAERLDLLLIHRPSPLLDADEVARAFIDLKQAGKVLHFGVSNFLPHQFDLLASRLPFPLVTNQVQISVLHTEALENGTLDQCQRLRIHPMAWSPLHGGRLLHEDSPRAHAVRECLAKMASEHNATAEQLAIAWILMHPAKPVVVLGTCNPDRLRAQSASEQIKMTRDNWFKIWTSSHGRTVA